MAGVSNLFSSITSAELGIDSNEMREILLAKIYELSNPSSSMGKMEDDFLRKLVEAMLM